MINIDKNQQKTRVQILSIVACTILLLPFQNCSSGFESSEGEGDFSSNSGSDDNSGASAQQPPAPAPAPAPIPQPTGRIDVFFAQGHMGRTLISCDDGRTWIRDRSADDSARCWISGDPRYVECDHTPYSGTGIDSGDGWLFARAGWGYEGIIRRSRDGMNWETLRTDSLGSGIAYSAGRLLAATGSKPNTSLDQGMTWINGPTFNGYDFASLRRIGTKFYLFGRPAGTNIVGISYDQGQTWSNPPALQFSWVKSIAEKPGLMAAIGYNDANVVYSAVSSDDGRTWTTRQQMSLTGVRWNNLFADGNKFVAFSSGRKYESLDGMTWTSQTIQFVDLNGNLTPATYLENISFNPATRTYVALPYEFGQRYESMRAYRSTDGLFWQQLSSTAFKPGHPIRNIIVGQIDRANCP